MQLIARLGRWLRTALNICCLRFFKPGGLLAAAGWPKDNISVSFSERIWLDVAAELVAALLPVEKVQSMVRVLWTTAATATSGRSLPLPVVQQFPTAVDNCGCCN
jgi:hypothetical protein